MSRIVWILFVLIFITYCFMKEECFFKMEKIPGLYPLIKTDKNGKKCSGEFLLPACVGFCKTSESGTHEFPYSKQESKVCALMGDEMENVTLTNCDPDADPSIQWVLIPKSKACGCKNLTFLKSKGI